MFYFSKNNTYKTFSKYTRKNSHKRLKNRITLILSVIAVSSLVFALIALIISASTSNKDAIYEKEVTTSASSNLL